MFIMIQDELDSEIHTDRNLVHLTKKYLPWVIRRSENANSNGSGYSLVSVYFQASPLTTSNK